MEESKACTGCQVLVTLDLKVRKAIAGDQTSPLWIDRSGLLMEWSCPSCGVEDALEPDF